MGIVVVSVFVCEGEPRWQLPVTIEVTRDVEVRTSEHLPDGSSHQLRATLYSSEAFWIRKGQRFLMMKIYTEGACRIRFKNGEYDLSSCPWLDGFRDHQTDTFRVLIPSQNPTKSSR
jgi:hypothetical protein